MKQCSSLLSIKTLLLADVFKSANKSDLHMVDGVPIPVINLARAKKNDVLRNMLTMDTALRNIPIIMVF